MERSETLFKKKSNRRSFIKNGMVAAGAATVGAGLAASGVSTFGYSMRNSAASAIIPLLRLRLHR